MVNVINPQLGETILDPAAGTGGFLVEAFEHLKVQCKKSEDFDMLQKKTLYGFEAKSLPYLLCQMNMLLHGIEAPEVDSGNALRFSLREMGDKDRVDIVITNPPFGGEEEPGIQGNFPEDKRTAETALLFLQLIMRKLRRPSDGKKGGRCGMVVPNGVLFDTGVGARIKKELLESFNLNTIVRLPKGVFAPYTNIETNLLFFQRDGPTKEIWYYENPLPSEREEIGNPCYTKSHPITSEDFNSIVEWWNNRVENSHAWKVTIEKIASHNYDLDIKNPEREIRKELQSPREILVDIAEKQKKILEIVKEITELVEEGNPIK